MKIRAQIGMVLNLDKCIGCHTCSVTCKNVWTSREGVEYAWFNNVETKPGIGYPKDWENQKRWNGGWTRTSNGSLRPKAGSKWRILAKIFANPDLPEIDDLRPSEYIAKVANAVRAVPRWEVIQDDMLLGMFSFAKLLMYRDLDPEKWPPHSPIEQHTNIAGLLGDEFGDEEPMFADGTHLDEILDPKDQFHVVDADASQALVIEEVHEGRNLVIQGPPGTGKSQTITNRIASAVKDGKRVLFVAEKRAALEVVHRRLSNIGLGELCLELHSHKARKKTVLAELRHVLELGTPFVEYENTREDLTTARARLNKHANNVNEPVGARSEEHTSELQSH